MRIAVLFFTAIINLVLQSTLFEYIEIIGIKPNTTVLFVVSYSILRGDTEGAALGFFTGLLQDCFFGDFIGMHALMYMIIGYVCGKPFKDFFHENIFFPLILGSIGIFSYGTAFYIMNYLFRGKLDFLYYLRRIILPEAVYTIAFTTPVYRLVYAINNRIEKREKRGRMLFDPRNK